MSNKYSDGELLFYRGTTEQVVFWIEGDLKNSFQETAANQPVFQPSIDDIQQALTELGIETGPVDGILGEMTTRAINEWQTLQGFEADGALTLGQFDQLKSQADQSTLQIDPKDIQQALVDLDYDLGTYGPNGDGVDGDLGRLSLNAIQQWQDANGFDSNGEINAEQFASLQAKAVAHLEQEANQTAKNNVDNSCLLYTSPSPRDKRQSRMPSSA